MMKKTAYILLFLFITGTILHCICPGETVCQTSTIGGITGIGPNIELSDSEIIIRIKDAVKDIDDNYLGRLDSIIEFYFKIKFVRESCQCTDDRRYVIRFTEDILNIETKLGALNGGPGGSEVEGERQYIITLPKEGDGLAVDLTKSKHIPEYIAERQGQINIAILDTGIDLNHIDPGLLFPNPPGLQCGEGASGWNFVNNDSDITDDHGKIGHGTLVTKTIISNLDRDSINYRLLPLKVFDSLGRGTYWNIVCAMSFLNQVQEKSSDAIKIVNASFGGSLGILNQSTNSSLKYYIDAIESKAVFVTSAGNCHFNTDDLLFRHYPSGYSSRNVVAVAGYHFDGTNFVVHDTSNYGKKNIDVAAKFVQSLAIDVNGDGQTEQLQLEGTSYSTAYVSSIITKLINSYPNSTFQDAVALRLDFLKNHTETNRSKMKNCIGKGRYVK